MAAPEGGNLYPNLQDVQGNKGMGPPANIAPPLVQQVIVNPNFGSEPQNSFCATCQTNVNSSISTEASSMAWIACVLLCCFGCWPCACIPFCVCQKTKHHCPNCKTFLGECTS
ncbi:LITAF [Lepeophtheirus salmonis]|uniref:LITAF n=1 Tax=Lepeophtheirus salmonis TaxID=72036 RepID=D3PGV8_LEPSM|nr:cell death-inducing p53-target protein 1 homolog [Lepeophtheirus salmonis]ADD24504.1 Protein LITAF homolog [Lepeophtheirus salmonis]CAB4069007.1 LITAF [Lepeophtheirus salmonis]CAF3019824.1 LITAF [Lepeophtheirus salmonis]